MQIDVATLKENNNDCRICTETSVISIRISIFVKKRSFFENRGDYKLNSQLYNLFEEKKIENFYQF